MRSKQLKNTELEPLDDHDIRVIRAIYVDVWEERGTIGGPSVWHDVIVRYLKSKGYEIKKRDAATKGE